MDRRHPARLIRHAAQRTCRRSMRTATAALGTTMSRPSSLAGSHRVSLPISSQGAAKDCALSLTWSGRAAENAGLLKRQHRSRSQRRFPEDALVANVGCRRISPIAAHSGDRLLSEPTAGTQPCRREPLFMPQRSRSRDWRDRARCAFGDPQRRRVLEHIRNLSHKNRTCAAIMLRSAASRVQPLG